jgi:hypothetical protein
MHDVASVGFQTLKWWHVVAGSCASGRLAAFSKSMPVLLNKACFIIQACAMCAAGVSACQAVTAEHQQRGPVSNLFKGLSPACLLC